MFNYKEPSVNSRHLANRYRRQGSTFKKELDCFLKKPLQSPKMSRVEGLPLLSIVMPSYNCVKYIEKSILSIVAQEYPNFELIIIDGGSNDGTVRVIEKYSQYISFWVSETDFGQSDALNKGFSRANGDIFGWLNADDAYLRGAFHSVVETFSMRETSIGVVFGDWIEADNDDNFLDYRYAFDFSLRHLAYEGFMLHPQASFWRRAVHQRFGKFDENLHQSMDYDMFLRFGLVVGNNGFARVSRPLGLFRRHCEQKTQVCSEERSRIEHRKVHEKLGLFMVSDASALILWNYFRFRRALWCVRRGGFVELFRRATPWALKRLRS